MFCRLSEASFLSSTSTVDGDGCMEQPERVRLPEGFEDVDVDILVQLVGVLVPTIP